MRIKTIVERAGLTPRSHSQIMKKINGELGEAHKRRRVPRHFASNEFTRQGGKYGYRKRSERTKRSKAARGMDANRPLYQTGALLSQVMSSGTVRKTQHRWTWTARGTKERPIPKWMIREIEIVSPDERQRDTVQMGKRYVALAASPQFARKRRKRIS